MTTLRWCEHCQQRTAHHDNHLPPGVIWIGNKQHEYDTDWFEIYCSRCKAHTMHYWPHELGEDDIPSDPPVYYPHTTDKGHQPRS